MRGGLGGGGRWAYFGGGLVICASSPSHAKPKLQSVSPRKEGVGHTHTAATGTLHFRIQVSLRIDGVEIRDEAMGVGEAGFARCKSGVGLGLDWKLNLLFMCRQPLMRTNIGGLG